MSELSPLIETHDEEAFPLADFSEDDVGLIYEKLSKARDERSMPRKEFDMMVFEQDYERNRESAFSYLRPKKNDDDVRVNSGTSEKKIELMHNELMSMNFQPSVRAYDKNNMELVELGADFTDIVRTTNTQENDEDIWDEVITDLLTQRAAFVEECMIPESAEDWYGKGAPGYLRAKKRRLSPLQVYLSDIYSPVSRISDQPYIVVYDRFLYAEAKVMFGQNKNWKYVRPGVIHDEFVPWFKYRFSTLRANEVEIMTIMSSSDHDDYYQQIVNGVPMHPKGTPMPCRKGYPIAAATAKQIPDFAYGKPPIASAKFLQGLQDETLRNLIRKMRQAIEPPLGVNNGKVYGRDVWSPGATTVGLVRDNFSKLIDHQGVTSSEFQMFQLITQKAEEFIGMSNIGQQMSGSPMTATQILELQKQSIKMLGKIVLAVTRLKRDATFLRLDSIFEEYMEPISKEIEEHNGKKEVRNRYRSFEVNDPKNKLGQIAKRFIVLGDKLLTDAEIEDVLDYEDYISAKSGKKIRYSFMNVPAIKAIPILFHVEVTPEQRDSGSLDKILFQDKMAQAIQIMQVTGRHPSADRIVSDFESTWRSKGWFEPAQQPMQQPGQPMAAGAAPGMPAAMGGQQAAAAVPGGMLENRVQKDAVALMAQMGSAGVKGAVQSELGQRQSAALGSILKQ